MSSLSSKGTRDQNGLASIVIVGVLVVLLSLISIGFARLMSRAVNSSVNNQLSTAASYAAQSALNDTIAWAQANPGVAATSCNTLIAGALSTPNNNLKNASNGTTQYSCLLVNPTPTDLLFQDIPSSRSQVVSITPCSGNPCSATGPNGIGSMTFSWQSPDRSLTNLPAAGSSLIDETAWNSNKYVPMLRLTLYPVPTNKKADDLESDSRTFFLYPTNGGGSLTNIDYKTVADGTLAGINCNYKSASANYDCNASISNLTNNTTTGQPIYYYARLTPIYGAADIRLVAYDNGSPPTQLSFLNDQSVLDVTAKSGGSAKRLQARVDTGAAGASGSSEDISPSQDGLPEFALQSAKAICKRLIVGTSTTSYDGSTCAINGLSTLPAPTVSLSLNPKTGSAPLSGTVTWTVTNASSCTASMTAGVDPSWTGAKSATGGSQPFSSLAAGTYTYNISCTGPSGSNSANDTVTVTTPTPPPPPPPGSPPPPPPPGGGGGGLPNCTIFSTNGDNVSSAWAFGACGNSGVPPEIWSNDWTCNWAGGSSSGGGSGNATSVSYNSNVTSGSCNVNFYLYGCNLNGCSSKISASYSWSYAGNPPPPPPPPPLPPPPPPPCIKGCGFLQFNLPTAAFNGLELQIDNLGGRPRG